VISDGYQMAGPDDLAELIDLYPPTEEDVAEHEPLPPIYDILDANRELAEAGDPNDTPELRAALAFDLASSRHRQAVASVPPILDQLDAFAASHRLADGGELPVGRYLADFLAESTEGIRWAVRNLIVDGSLVAVLGRPESFKSMSLLHLGLALAGGPGWLGFELGDPRPFVYASNEKTGSTVRERLRRMTAQDAPTEPVVVMHRAGVTFGDPRRWDAVVAVVAAYAAAGRPPFVALDTLASLSGPGFNENSGEDMGAALGAIRRLTDLGATVALGHHPAKHAEGSGGIIMRGHSSLHGEVDGSLQFTRPDREAEAGLIRGEPKDADLVLVRFNWSRETFLLERADTVSLLTARTLAAVVGALYAGDPLSADRIRAEFPGHGRSVFAVRLAEAVDAGLIRRSGRGRATVYESSTAPDDSSPSGWPA
jgi:hypothetical protein